MWTAQQAYSHRYRSSETRASTPQLLDITADQMSGTGCNDVRAEGRKLRCHCCVNDTLRLATPLAHNLPVLVSLSVSLPPFLVLPLSLFVCSVRWKTSGLAAFVCKWRLHVPPADCSARRHSRASLRYLSSLKRCWSLMISGRRRDALGSATASHSIA